MCIRDRSIQSSDIFINVTGGLQIKEPACDLAILCALASSFKEIPVDFKTVLIGEVGPVSYTHLDVYKRQI